MKDKERSPFTPGNPVPRELFVGRSEQVTEALRYIKQSVTGKQENVFLAGERGIGKSSFASFLRYLAASEDGVLGVHVFLARVSSLEEMARHIFDALLKECKDENWFDKIKGFFGSYIREVGLFGVSATFAPPEDELRRLVREFPQALMNLVEKIKDEKNGLFIALDDINGLAETGEFANWYKSFVDDVATHYDGFPVFVMPIGTPEKRDLLANAQPSLMRIFRIIEIKKLSDSQVREFLSNAFSEAEMTVEPDALDAMVMFSSGLPILMHEIGDAAFWLNSDGVIDRKDALRGVMKAADSVGAKYLEPQVYNAIRSERYRSILRKLARVPTRFTKKNVEAGLDGPERKVFHNFLRRLRELGIIETDVEGGRGAYRFVNEIYPLYIYMEAQRSERTKGS